MNKVAIVDDSLTTGKVLVGYMKSIPNIEPIAFTCPKLALDWCDAQEPDLVLLDYMMPEMDGIEFLRRFRCAQSLRDVPVIVVTGDEGKESLYQALHCGATDFLRKPVDRVELIARARNMLDLRNRQRQLAQANDQLYLLASTDSLTGLKNRRYFMEALNKEIERSSRSQRPSSLMLLDVDHFKKVNDTFGHDVGDTVLQSLSRTLTDMSREGDCVGRMGGEEFAMLLAEIAIPDALKVGERLLEAVRFMKFEADDCEFACTVSLGLTELRHDGDTSGAVLKRADMALYRAKTSGRDCIEVTSPDAYYEANVTYAGSQRRRVRAQNVSL